MDNISNSNESLQKETTCEDSKYESKDKLDVIENDEKEIPLTDQKSINPETSHSDEVEFNKELNSSNQTNNIELGSINDKLDQETPKFYEDLKLVIRTQENILSSTSMAKEKLKYANEISVDQLKNFKDNSNKYGKYLKLIHDELSQISDLMRKIKKEIK